MWNFDKGSKAPASELRSGRRDPHQRSVWELDCDICTIDISFGDLSGRINFLSQDPSSRKICKKCHERLGSIIEKFVKPVNDSKIVLDPIREIKVLLLEMNQRQQEQFTFFSEIASAFRDHLHTDILVKPGRENGPAIPAHKVILAAKSVVFKNMIEFEASKNMMESERCKGKESDSITVPELNHEELKMFLGFLYDGHFRVEEIRKNYPSLLRAAQKYKVAYLEKFCVHEMDKSLSKNTVLDFLEIADACSDKTAKDKALDFIKKHKSVLLSTRYDSLAHKNPRLAVEITRCVAEVRPEGEEGMPWRMSQETF